MDGRFDPSEFVPAKVKEISDTLKEKRVLLACSGGVCSNVMAALFRKATNRPNISSVFIDTGFMRDKENRTVIETLSRAPLKLELRSFDARKKFSRAMEHAQTGLAKRAAFSEAFESTLNELAEEENAELVALGSRATGSVTADQSVGHDASARWTRDSVGYFRPLLSLNRAQIAQVAQTLELPPRLSELAPFPSLGLSIRTLGKISDEKIRLAREATSIVEEELRYIRPAQYFAAILDDREEKNEKTDRIREKISDLLDVGSDQVEMSIPQCNTSALADHKRVYLKAVATRVTLLGSKELLEPDLDDLTNFSVELIGRYKEFGRCLYSVTRKSKNGKYQAIIRAVSTEDWSKADVARLEWGKLHSIADRIMAECGKISSVYYDVTPKPPATVEFE